MRGSTPSGPLHRTRPMYTRQLLTIGVSTTWVTSHSLQFWEPLAVLRSDSFKQGVAQTFGRETHLLVINAYELAGAFDELPSDQNHLDVSGMSPHDEGSGAVVQRDEIRSVGIDDHDVRFLSRRERTRPPFETIGARPLQCRELQ